MKETTKKILSALATSDSGEVIGLPIAPDLYPELSLEAAIQAFTPYLWVERIPGGAQISIKVDSQHLSDAPQIIGEFLNYLLSDAATRLLRGGN